MLPAFEKKSGLVFPKRDSQILRELNKTIATASEFESPFGERDRNKNLKSRQHSRSITRYDSLPTIMVTASDPTARTYTGTTGMVMSEDGNMSSAPRTEKGGKVGLCFKRWKKISLNRSHTSTFSLHGCFEVSWSLFWDRLILTARM